MTKYQFEKEIQDRIELDTDQKIDIKDIKKIIETSEELIIELIATENSVRFDWGIIGGKSIAPHKVDGSSNVVDAMPDPYSFSFGRKGVPHVWFTRKAKFCTLIPAHEWFMNPENQYGKSWDKYKAEMEKDLGGEKFKHFLGLYGIPKAKDRKIVRREKQKIYEKFLEEKEKDPDYINPTDPFTFDEMKNLQIWKEGSLRGI